MKKDNFIERALKKIIKKSTAPTIPVERINSAESMVGAALSGVNVEIDPNQLREAKWIRPEEELPMKPGFYLVLTDEHLEKGVAWYGESWDDDKFKPGEYVFEVHWASSGIDPKVYYWLKDNYWGLVYDFKQQKGEI